MKNKIPGIVFLGFFCQLAFPAFPQPKENNDSLEKIITVVNKQISFIDNAAFKSITASMPYASSPGRKIKVTAYIQDSVVRKFVYSSYDDSYTTTGRESYYFNETGKLIAHEKAGSDILLHEIFFYNQVIVNAKIGKDFSNMSYENDQSAFYILATTKFTVDYYLSGFSFLKYKTFDVAKNNSVVLKTIAATPLQKDPNVGSPVIKNLLKGTALMYLEKSSNLDSLNGNVKWAWYKVKTKQNQTGWIWGHPAVVREY